MTQGDSSRVSDPEARARALNVARLSMNSYGRNGVLYQAEDRVRLP